jgi:hypothetical protein
MCHPNTKTENDRNLLRFFFEEGAVCGVGEREVLYENELLFQRNYIVGVTRNKMRKL